MGLAAFQRMRRLAQEKDVDTVAAGTAEEVVASKLTVPEIKAKLAELGIDLPDGAKKPDLVALLDEALKQEEGADATANKATGQTPAADTVAAGQTE